MKKRIISYSVLLLILFSVGNIMSPIRFAGVSPDFVLVGIICLAMLENEYYGSLFGLVFGLLCDFSSAGVFGLNALTYMAVGYLTGFLTDKFISVSLFGSLFLSAVFSTVSGVITGMLYSFFSGEALTDILLYIELPKLIMNVASTVVIYFIFRLLRHIITRREEREGTW